MKPVPICDLSPGDSFRFKDDPDFPLCYRGHFLPLVGLIHFLSSDYDYSYCYPNLIVYVDETSCTTCCSPSDR